MTTNTPLTLNGPIATHHLTILANPYFKDFNTWLILPAILPFSVPCRPKKTWSNSTASSTPLATPFSGFTTAQELLNASLQIIQVTVSEADQHVIDTHPTVICASPIQDAQLLRNSIPRLKDTLIASRYPARSDIAGKVVYGNVLMKNLAIHAASIVATTLAPEDGGVRIDLHPAVTVLPM